jgi:NAD(P)-dependent dehydrogenase (short-subunit alcohol dehydrogenase family)
MISEKTILVTGATDGIGKATALQLADLGARVIVHGRTGKRVGEALRDFPLSAKIDAISADFTSLRQVREMAREILERYPRLDVLVNNAGVYQKERLVTEDGYEATFQINYLAPFYLTYLLHELLLKSAPSRVVNVSSMVHSAGEMHLDDLQAERRPYDGYDAYAQSKLGNVLFTYDLLSVFQLGR